MKNNMHTCARTHTHTHTHIIIWGFPGGSMVKNLPQRGNGNPLQYSCLDNPMDRGAWWATVHGVAKRLT